VRAIDGIDRLIVHRAEEVVDPFAPLAAGADREEALVVFVAVPFEKGAEIKQRLVEQFLRVQQESDEQAAHTPVAIEERMNGLELVMNEGETNQRGQVRLGMEELLEHVERRVHLRNRWWNVGRVRNRRSGLADPILHAAKLARRAALAANAGQQLRVHLA